MAHNYELQQKQITEPEEADQPVIRVVRQPDRRAVVKARPFAEKPLRDKPPIPKPRVEYEGAMSPRSVSEIPLPLLNEAPKTLSKEEAEKPAVVPNGMERRQNPAASITEPDQEHQTIPDDEHDIPAVTVATEVTVATTEIPKFFDLVDADTLPSEEVIPQETDLAEANVLLADEAVFDDEVMAAFEQLAGLIHMEREEVSLAATEPYEIFTQDMVIFLNQETAEPIEADEPNVFEEFLMSKPRPENSPDIDTIVADANNRSLEETFVELSFFLAEAAEETDDISVEATAIKEALKAVIEALPGDNVNYVDGEEKTAITPEFTQKLLVLLEAVGYDEPQEVLIEFVKQHDFEFLLQAIRYLHQLADDSSRQEFLPSRALNFKATNIDEPLITRLGQAIIRYFFMYKTASEL